MSKLIHNVMVQRVQALEQAFARIQRERMADVPVLNPSLQVQAVGFALEPGEEAEPSIAWGVLITPWFMNLIRLPLRSTELLAPGSDAVREMGGQPLDFIGAQEPWLGEAELARYELCSLFSPMFEFADQAAAVATAVEVLRLLRAPKPEPAAAVQPALPSAAVPARRGFLFGRSASGAAR